VKGGEKVKDLSNFFQKKLIEYRHLSGHDDGDDTLTIFEKF